ncbi:hypothetical protein AHiyo8_60550 [Arthrobacter sp. Hiyo8]|nr:hypothetical protein AHiyo8_60550 [Arthrobacter sp. Hiyo8]
MDNEQVVAAAEDAASTETTEAPKKVTRTRRKAAPKTVAADEAPTPELPQPPPSLSPKRATRKRPRLPSGAPGLERRSKPPSRCRVSLKKRPRKVARHRRLLPPSYLK